jgi:DNA-binding NarL/FixJ family response regulator
MSEPASFPEPGVSPQVPEVNVVVSVQNELQRFGIERMLQSLGPQVHSTVNPTLQDGLDAVLADESAVLIVASRDVEGPVEGKLRRAITGGAKILVLFDERELANPDRLASIRSGGYLCSEELSARTLADALLRILDGEVPIPSRLAHNLLALVGEPKRRPSAPVRMTPREKQVLVLLIDGLSNKQIARQLGISEHGAKRLVANLMAKLDCPTRTLVVAKALREGLVGSDPAVHAEH